MGHRLCHIDFEFGKVSEPMVKLVCATTHDSDGVTTDWWLKDSSRTQSKLAAYLKTCDIILGYSCVAEARSFIALGLEPLDWRWIDLFLEYRLITNHNDKLLYGTQLVDGKVKFTRKPKPKWERTEQDIATGFSPSHSLVEATYKLTGQIRDSEHKTKMRDLIISAPDKFSPVEREAIQAYCREDVVFLPTIWKRIKEEFKLLRPEVELKEYITEAMVRGRYSVHTAHMENDGYPINVEATRNFSKQVGNILFDVQREINDLFPEINPFRWNRKSNRYSENQKHIKEWIKKIHFKDNWIKTASGGTSLSLDAWSKYYNFAHDYPTDNFGAQMIRYLKLKQSLYGFNVDATGGRKNFWDAVGTDGRVRPYMNHYKAQSSRSQPAATAFLFLKPAWMRALCQPAPGKFMAGIDYGSQEFFIAALDSQDENMIQAYLSGDPYLAFGKISKQIPEHGTKESHGAQRNLCKSTVLGISYLMSKYGLANKLTNDTGKIWTEDDAQEQIDLFYEAFSDLSHFQSELIEEYDVPGGHIKLPCGWYMWGDNDNHRSVTNVPIQGKGASIMRKAVDIAVAKGCKVLFTLHDAIYIEGDVGNEMDILKLRNAMKAAMEFYYDGRYKELAGKIKLDPFAWSPDYKPDSEVVIRNTYHVPASNLYLDSRAERDYNKFKQYFDAPVTDLL